MKEKYTTTDIGIAATIVALGGELLGMDKIKGKIIVMKFSQEANVIARAYHEKMLVPAKAYFFALKDLKSRIANFR